MNQINFSTRKEKFKHLNEKQLDSIIREYNNYITTVRIEFRFKHVNRHLKVPRRNIGKTEFIRTLATKYNTSTSNVYKIINSSKITVLDQNYKEKTEYSFTALIGKRKMRKPSNNSKLVKAKPFIDLVVHEVLKNKLSSIDETINHYKRHNKESIKGFTTVCTSTMYNYVKSGLIALKPMDLPRMLRRKPKVKEKTYTNPKTRGTSIDERPDYINNRLEFGHWEGDLVTGPRDGINGALLTLAERQGRFFYTIPIKDKKAKTVYMTINRLAKHYGSHFNIIFKSITFDNGSEFSRYKDIEKRHKIKIYFAHPYCSYERGTNEISNQLIRYFIPKGTDINTIDKSFIWYMQYQINNKKRKILNYLSAESLFKNMVFSLTNGEINNIYLNF